MSTRMSLSKLTYKDLTQSHLLSFHGYTLDAVYVGEMAMVMKAAIGIDVSAVPIYFGKHHIDAFLPSTWSKRKDKSAFSPDLVVTSGDEQSKRQILAVLFESGTKIGDILFFLSTPKADRHKFNLLSEVIPQEGSVIEIQKALLAMIFLFWRSDKLIVRSGEAPPRIFGYRDLPNLSQAMFSKLISRIDPDAYPREILVALGDEYFDTVLRSSLQLGKAGTRQMAFISKHKPMAEIEVKARDHIIDVRTIHQAAKSRIMHTSVKPLLSVGTFGSINNYCDDIIVGCYSVPLVKAAVEARELYMVPYKHGSSISTRIFSEANLLAVNMIKNPQHYGTNGEQLKDDYKGKVYFPAWWKSVEDYKSDRALVAAAYESSGGAIDLSDPKNEMLKMMGWKPDSVKEREETKKDKGKAPAVPTQTGLVTTGLEALSTVRAAASTEPTAVEVATGTPGTSGSEQP